MSAIKSMNNCVRGYLHLEEKGGIIIYNDIGENTEEYINKLEFKEGEELDLQQEWDKFCDEFFNDWINTGNNFYREVDDLAREFNSREMIYLIKMVNDYWLETTGEPFDLAEADEEKIWNNIAYAWIRVRSDNIRDFVLKKIQEKFDEWLEEQKEDGDYPLSCDICYRNKLIETYAACCNDKKFCGGCYKKLKGKLCPFCRGEITHTLGDDEICNKTEFQDWLFKFNRINPYIVNKEIVANKN
jgi:hypothetical protein